MNEEFLTAAINASGEEGLVSVKVSCLKPLLNCIILNPLCHSSGDKKQIHGGTGYIWIY